MGDEIVTTNPIRISKIAGRYFIFDYKEAGRLRRQENTCGYLVGTAPQQPTQNVFLGLPIEVRLGEVQALVQKKAAVVIDDIAAHQAALNGADPEARKAYIDSLRRRKRAAQQNFDNQRDRKAAEVTERLGRSVESTKKQSCITEVGNDYDTLFSPCDARHQSADAQTTNFAVTPTSSGNLVSMSVDTACQANVMPSGSLCRFLQGSGYFMTPGLRFGCQYSVYPGDPLRFHAHFMANSYAWDEEIPILDIVSGGRLATAVKKAFLIGGRDPNADPTKDDSMRTFSIEWASM